VLYDSDWFAAGKGPDPVQAALDKDMDSYFNKKTAAGDASAAIPAAEAGAVSETVSA
jgi:hypothetical protein